MKKPLPASVVYRKLSDDELAHRCARRRDRTAALELHARYGHLIFGLCLQVLPQTEEAEAASRNVFFKLLEEGNRFRTEAFKPWLYRRVQELAGGGSPVESAEFDKDTSDTGYTAEEARSRAVLMAAFATLPPEAQVVLDGFYLHGQTHAELAAVLGTSEAAVFQRISEGRRDLKAALKTAKPGSPQSLEDVVHLLHLLEEGRCLSRKQLIEYTGGQTGAEEAHAVEHHLHACPLCCQATAAVQAGGAGAHAALVRHTDAFLTEHHRKTSPQLQTSSVLTLPRKRSALSLWRIAAVAAGAVIGLGLLWHFDSRMRSATPTAPVGDAEATTATPQETAPKPVTATPAVVVQPAVSHAAAPPKSSSKRKAADAPIPVITEEGRPVSNGAAVQPEAAPAPAPVTDSPETPAGEAP